MRDTIRIALLSLVVIAAEIALSQDDNCRGWIPDGCCCTNNCCETISGVEVEPVEKDRWRVIASGQVLKRTDWSPDGTYILCHCDYRNGRYVVSPTAHARCIFVPRPNAGLSPVYKGYQSLQGVPGHEGLGWG